jgi:ABC-type uncharacterized transport system permease subunit
MDTVTSIFVAAVALYTASCALFFVHLVRGDRQSMHWAPRLLWVAMAAHGLFIASDYLLLGKTDAPDIYETSAVLSLLIALAYLATMRKHRLIVLGAFITPVTLLLFLAAGLRNSVPPVPEHVRSAILPLHITVNMLGIAAFALAFAAAVGYVIQEQLLRKKHVVGVFQRLPALDVLDSLGFRLVTIGFPLFTLGMLTGSIWAARGGFSLSAGQGFALLAWIFFGCVLLARAAAGWRGRRAAIGTMLGFLFSLAAIGGYLVRGFDGS